MQQRLLLNSFFSCLCQRPSIIMTTRHTPAPVEARLKKWRLFWRVSALAMVAGLLFFGYGAQPMLMLGVGLAGTAALWLSLSQLEKPKAPLSIKDKYDHWQAELQQVQTQLKGAQFLVGKYQQQIEQLRQELHLSQRQAAAPAPATATTPEHAALAHLQSEQALQRQFLATLNHEIRTPMNGLVGMTQMALQTELTVQQREFIGLAHESAKHLMNTINDVLDFSKIQAGHLSLEMRPCHPVDVMHQTLRSFYPQAGAKGLTLYYEDLPNTAPPMLMDPLRLRQVLSHLIGNAIKFTHQGFVQTSMHLSPGDRPGLWLLSFVVQDSGVGFEQDQAEALFQAFQKGDQPTSPFSGTGLGLAISRSLVNLMGGHIEVESRPNLGSTFRFTVTCTQAVEAAVIPFNTLPNLTRAKQPLHVLVAEDHPINMKLIALLLDQMGHTYAQAKQGEEAVQLFQQQRFDLVLMDVMMPVMDGMTALRHLRQAQGASRTDTPVIMVTAYAMSFDRQRFLDAGADGYVSKPIDAPALQAEIHRLLPHFVSAVA